MRLRLLRIILYTMCCLAPVMVQAQQKSELAPLPIAEGLAAPSFSPIPISVSPTNPQFIVYQLFDIRRWGKVEWGQYLTKTGAPSLSRGGDIWLTNTDTGESKNLTGGQGWNWGPVWSPNGQFIAFYSDRDGAAAVWLWDRITGRLRRASQAIHRPFLYGRDILSWTSDSHRLLVKILPQGVSLERSSRKTQAKPAVKAQDGNEVRISIYQSKADPKRSNTPESLGVDTLVPEKFPEFIADLALIDIRTGKVQRLARNFVLAGCWLSPIGDNAAFLAQKGVKRTSDYVRPVFDLVVVSLKDGRTTVVASDIVQGTLGDRVSWSPDGRWLCYVSISDALSDWFLVPASGGTSRKVSEEKHPPFNVWEQPPLWSPDGQSLYAYTADAIWKIAVASGAVSELAKLPDASVMRIVTRSDGRLWSPDGGKSMVAATRENLSKRPFFYKIDLVSSQLTKLIGNGHINQTIWITTAEGSQDIYYVTEDARHSPDIWAINAGSDTSVRRITRINPLFERYVMGESRMVEWQSANGQPLRGALLLPAGYREGQRYPLIVYIYGGALLSESRSLFGYSSGFNKALNMQFWATRGYAVFLPDAPLRTGTTMQDLAKTVLPGVDRVIEMGIADPERLGIWGGSFGGYSVLALITQTTRFKAAICDSGFINLLTIYGWMPDRANGPRWQGWAEAGQGNMGGTPWQYRERYIDNSPLFFLDRVQTPVLIIQGLEDPGAKDFYSNELFVNLRRLGKEALYLKYADGSHTIASFRYVEQIDVLNRMIRWFDSHLKSPNEIPIKKRSQF